MTTLKLLAKKSNLNICPRHLDGGLAVTDYTADGPIVNQNITLRKEGQIYVDRVKFVDCVFTGEVDEYFFDRCMFVNCTFDKLMGNHRGRLRFSDCESYGDVFMNACCNMTIEFWNFGFDSKQSQPLCIMDSNLRRLELKSSHGRYRIDKTTVADCIINDCVGTIVVEFSNIRRFETKGIELGFSIYNSTIGAWVATGKVKGLTGYNFSFGMTNIDSAVCDFPEYLINRLPSVPEKGEFVAWKFAEYTVGTQSFPCILKLHVPAEAARVNGLTRAARVSKVVTLGVFDTSGHSLEVNEAQSALYRFDRLKYKVGEETLPNHFNDEPLVTSTSGIHVYSTFEEAKSA